MHLRISGAHPQRLDAATDKQQLLAVMTASATTSSLATCTAAAGGGRTTTVTTTKKCVLCLVVALQIGVICCFWLLQLGFTASMSSGEGDGELQAGSSGTARNDITSGNNVVRERVNFIKQAVALLAPPPAEHQLNDTVMSVPTKEKAGKVRSSGGSNFAQDFYLLKAQTLNATEEETTSTATSFSSLWCFREGTLNASDTSRHESFETNDYLGEMPQRCECRTNWHGRDCGQPELMWRALMTAKQPFRLQQPQPNTTQRRLLHLLEGNLLSLDLLELQLRTVATVVDYTLLYWHIGPAATQQRNERKELERRLRDVLPQGNYNVYEACPTTPAKSAKPSRRCYNSSAHVYRHFRRRAPLVGSSDLLLQTSDRALMSPQALRFLKYYAPPDVGVLRFRLKHTVYGFYWQHPALTRLSGTLSSLRQLDSSSGITTTGGELNSSTPAQLIVGDLNHYGGWYCEYCQQPDEIIAELHAETTSSLATARAVRFPNATRGGHIDAPYVQRLIATGLHVDGSTQLQRVRAYSERGYYAPKAAEQSSWKFGHLLVNLYESLDDDDGDEEADF